MTGQNPANPRTTLTEKATKSRMSANKPANHAKVAMREAKIKPIRCAHRAMRKAIPEIPAAIGCKINALVRLFRVEVVAELNG